MHPPTDSPLLDPAFNGEGAPFAALMQQADVAIAQTDATGRFVRANARWLEILGYSLGDLLERSVDEVTHPDSRPATAENIARLAGGAPPIVQEKKYVRKDGSVLWARATICALRDEFGAFSGMVALVVDLGAQRRGRQLIESQNDALQLIISGASLEQVFRRLIAMVEEDGDAVGSVLLVEHATGRLRHGAAPSLPDAYNRAIDGLRFSPDLGTCAAAAARNEMVITPDLAAAPEWRDFRHLPLALGLRAAWSMPIVSAGGTVLGTFGTYFRACRRPTRSEIETVSMLAKTAAVAIERRLTEDRLRLATRQAEQHHRLYQTALSNTPDLVYVYNLEHRFTYANEALLAMWGRSWSEAIGKNCLELGYEPWHAAMHDREIDQVIATRRPIRGEVAFRGTNGRRSYDYIFAPVLGANGEVEAIAGTTRDVTDQRKAAATARFLADLAQDLAVCGDEGGIVRHTVEAVGRHLGVHRCTFVECHEEENLVKVTEDWVRDADARLTGSYSLRDFGGPEWWAECLKGDFAVEDIETHPLLGPDKAASHRALGLRSYAAQPIVRTGRWTVMLAVADKEPRAWTADELRLLENVAARVWPLVERARTEAALREARDEALAASRAKDDFLAALSHELRTPLNPVLLLASEAAGDQRHPAGVRADFETIVRNVTLEARLIDDLLDLTRIAHRKLALEFRPRDAHALLAAALETMQPELREKRLRLTLRLEAPSAIVSGDDVRLQQIFLNLLRNAAKFTPPGGSIAVATRGAPADPGRLIIEVSDSGIGLSAGELASVFNPFVQGEHSETGGASPYGGLGLGLAISQKLAELHSGLLSARSGGRGQGATFLVELPLAPAGSQAAVCAPAPMPPPSASPAGGCRRILLVEDHDSSRLALAQLLAARRLEVTQAASAAEALEKAKTQRFDLVISDIGLPDINGYELMATLQARHDLRGIALSGYGTEEDVVRSREAGFSAHLTKPVRAQVLDRILQELGREC